MLKLIGVIGISALAVTAGAAISPAQSSAALNAPADAGPGVTSVRVSGPTPFSGCPALPLDQQLPAGAVQPVVAVNPRDPANIVAVWQQDHDHGIVAGVSFDAGRSWRQVVIPGITSCTGGSYEYSDDVWASFGSDGALHVSVHVGDVVNGRQGASSRLYTRSTDGGLTWSTPVSLVPYLPPSEGVYGPGSIAADPSDPRLVYSLVATFAEPGVTQSTAFRGTVVLTRSTDGGRSWEPARVIYDTGPGRLTTHDHLVVLPNHELVDVFTLITDPARGQMSVAAIRSTDDGQTWSAPVIVATLGSAQVTDPQTGVRINNYSAGTTAAAVDPRTGRVYVAWEDSRWGGGTVNAIALSSSNDAGQSWTAPVKANATPASLPPLDQESFIPSVSVTANGDVGVAYYDLRATDQSVLLADRWLDVCRHAGNSACTTFGTEDRLTTNSFNLENAPVSSAGIGIKGYFLGEYEGLATTPGGFIAVFEQPAGSDPAQIFATTVRGETSARAW